jgi:hypothetical protein
VNADEARRRGLGAARGLVFVVLLYASLALVALAVWIAAKVLG